MTLKINSKLFTITNTTLKDQVSVSPDLPPHLQTFSGLILNQSPNLISSFSVLSCFASTLLLLYWLRVTYWFPSLSSVGGWYVHILSIPAWWEELFPNFEIGYVIYFSQWKIRKPDYEHVFKICFYSWVWPLMHLPFIMRKMWPRKHWSKEDERHMGQRPIWSLEPTQFSQILASTDA